MMHTVFQDLRYAARMLKNRPGFTLVAVITLSLGIGANTAIFSVVNAVVLNPLPFPHPEQIVLVRDDLSGRQLEDIGLSVDELKDFQERSGVFDQISAVWSVDANLTGSDRPERVELLAVSPNYFSLLGASAQLGRVFGPQDQAQGFAAISRCLKTKGRAAFWSASEDKAFAKRLAKAGFAVEVVAAKAYAQAKRSAHTIFVADRKS